MQAAEFRVVRGRAAELGFKLQHHFSGHRRQGGTGGRRGDGGRANVGRGLGHDGRTRFHTFAATSSAQAEAEGNQQEEGRVHGQRCYEQFNPDSERDGPKETKSDEQRGLGERASEEWNGSQPDEGRCWPGFRFFRCFRPTSDFRLMESNTPIQARRARCWSREFASCPWAGRCRARPPKSVSSGGNRSDRRSRRSSHPCSASGRHR